MGSLGPEAYRLIIITLFSYHQFDPPFGSGEQVLH